MCGARYIIQSVCQLITDAHVSIYRANHYRKLDAFNRRMWLLILFIRKMTENRQFIILRAKGELIRIEERGINF